MKAYSRKNIAKIHDILNDIHKNQENIVCLSCKKNSFCQNLCPSMTQLLEKTECKQVHWERNIANLDILSKKISPLSLPEMETEFQVVRQRKAVTLNLSSEDFAPIRAAGLSEKQRFVMHRHFWQQKTVRQIAGEMGVSHAAVGGLLKRGQEKLGRFLSAQGPRA